jgi:hypothetical protein
MKNKNNSLVDIRRREKGENRGNMVYIKPYRKEQKKKWQVALGYNERGKKKAYLMCEFTM